MALAVHEYTASGGPSERIELPGGTDFVIEAHDDSAALVFQTKLDCAGFIKFVKSRHDIRSAVDAVVNCMDTMLEGLQVRVFLSGFEDEAGLSTFVRLGFEDGPLFTLYTWTGKDSFTEGSGLELGYGIERFDRDIIAKLLAETATEEVAAAAEELLPRIERLTAYLG